MTNKNKNLIKLLFVGDVMAFLISLWVTLFIRYLAIPDKEILILHFSSFLLLFPIWLLVFFIIGLYGRQAYTRKQDLVALILKAQIVNSIIAIMFFYFVSYFVITPKTNLFIYIFVSTSCILLWRVYLFYRLKSRRKENIMIIANKKEIEELRRAMGNHYFYNLNVAASIDVDEVKGIDFEKDVKKVIEKNNISVIAADTTNSKVMSLSPMFYNLIFSKNLFIDVHTLYEDIFEKVPLGCLEHSWFLENISSRPRVAYLFFKRVLDISLALVLIVLSFFMYPFVFLAIKIEDGGKVFIKQKRLGQDCKIIKLLKIRSMNVDDGGVWQTRGDKRVTKTGKVLRKSRIDELPQLWSVLKGDMSLVGPRPDIVELGNKLTKEIPYYSIRYLVKPGLSGWAQIKQQKPPLSVEETKSRLEYDLYYIKNVSFMLDLKIALRTIKILLSRVGI